MWHICDYVLEDTAAVSVPWSKAVRNVGRFGGSRCCLPFMVFTRSHERSTCWDSWMHSKYWQPIPLTVHTQDAAKKSVYVGLCGLMAFRTIEIRRGHGKNNFPHLLFLIFLFSSLSSSLYRILTHFLIFFLSLNLHYSFLSISYRFTFYFLFYFPPIPSSVLVTSHIFSHFSFLLLRMPFLSLPSSRPRAYIFFHNRYFPQGERSVFRAPSNNREITVFLAVFPQV